MRNHMVARRRQLLFLLLLQRLLQHLPLPQRLPLPLPQPQLQLLNQLLLWTPLRYSFWAK